MVIVIVSLKFKSSFSYLLIVSARKSYLFVLITFAIYRLHSFQILSFLFQAAFDITWCTDSLKRLLLSDVYFLIIIKA